MSLTKHEIEAYIKEVPTAILATVDEQGNPDIRVLGGIYTEESLFYFTTLTSSAKVKQLRKNPQATVYFEKPGQNFPINYMNATLYGKAEEILVKDEFARLAEKIREKAPTLKITQEEYSIFRIKADKIKVYDTSSEAKIETLIYG